MNAKTLLGDITPDFVKQFESLPEYGCIGFKVYLHDSKLVRIEWSGTKSQKIFSERSEFRSGGAK